MFARELFPFHDNPLPAHSQTSAKSNDFRTFPQLLSFRQLRTPSLTLLPASSYAKQGGRGVWSYQSWQANSTPRKQFRGWPSFRATGRIETMPSEFNPLDWQLLCRLPKRMHKKSGWTEHVPLAMLLVELLQPRVLVELGTQRGVSYCAFCQAVAETKCATRCFAVDTWLGDVHATHYKESVFQELNEYHRQYESFSKLLRMTFDEALQHIPDRSVDLLHIDGLHFYEAVKKDYESWQPKLSDRAVVLFHDTMETEGGFGVHQLWRELSPNHLSFNMHHGHGLGILAHGPAQPPAFLDFLRTANEKPESTRALFASLGRRVLLETEKQWLSQQSPIGRTLAALKSKSRAAD
jgi:hypothetical protein